MICPTSITFKKNLFVIILTTHRTRPIFWFVVFLDDHGRVHVCNLLPVVDSIGRGDGGFEKIVRDFSVIESYCSSRLTTDSGTQFNLVEALSTNWTTIGSFHPGFQAFIMQIVSARQQMCYQGIIVLIHWRWGG